MSAWADYRNEVFGDPYYVWHDGADFSEIARRFAADPGTTTAMLTGGLAEGDELAAEAIREVPLTEGQRAGFTTLLTHVEASADAGLKVQAAASLHLLTGSPTWATSLVQVLSTPHTWGVKIDAVMHLAAFAPTQALVDGVAGAIADPASDYLVRFHASNTLLRWAAGEPAVVSEPPQDISTHPELFARLVEDSDPAGWAEVARLLAERVRLP